MNKVSLFFMSAVLMTGMVFTRCDKDDKDGGEDGNTSVVADNKIIAGVENGASYNAAVDEVKAILRMAGGNIVLGSGAYANGGFTIDLVATVDAQYLETIFGDGVSAGLTVSDPKAMGVTIEKFEAYKAGARTGEFYHENNPGGSIENQTEGIHVAYMYVDRDVTVTGSELGGEHGTTKNTYSMFLKKGWNIVYNTWTGEVETTETSVIYRTTTVTSVTGTPPDILRWHYYPRP